MPEFKQSDSEKIPFPKGCLFFLPLQKVLELINLPTLLKKSYKKKKRYGWLTWERYKYLMAKPSAFETSKQSTFLKMEKMVQQTPLLQQFRVDQGQINLLWQPYHEWTGLIASRCVNTPAGRRYWQERVEAEKELVSKLFGAADPRQRLNLLLDCDLAREGGCGYVRQEILVYLKEHPEAQDAHISTELIHFRLCAVASTLVRFAAWLVAEWELITNSEQERVPIEGFLPHYAADTAEWNNPVAAFLDYVATQLGCPNDRSVSAYLGELWADYEYEYKDEPNSQVTSKQKLLRNWMNGKGGRPTWQTVRAMTEAVANEAVGEKLEAFKVVTEGYARAFILLETCWCAQRDMKHVGIPSVIIEEIFSSYLPEYYTARQAIGFSVPKQGADG